MLIKLAVLRQLSDHPLLQPDAGLDTTAYVQLAREVLAGNIGLGPGLYYVSPLYIYFLAGGLWIFDSFTAIRVVQVVLGTASVWFIFLMTRIWFGERAAWAAATLAVVTGLFTFYEVLILQASLDAFLTSAGLLALARATATEGSSRAAIGWCGAAGLVFGIQTLNRPNVMLAVALIGATLLVVRRIRLAAALAAGLALGVAPVVARNAVVAGQFSLVSSHGGLNFYIGNNAHATGFYHPVPGITPTIIGQERDAKRLAEAQTGRSLSDAEVSDYFVSRALGWMREQPGQAAALMLRKLLFVFHSQHVALPHSYPFYVHETGSLLRALVAGPWLLVPLGLVGLVIGAPAGRRSGYLAWVSFVPAYALAVAAFFVAERYRLPLLVPLCAGSGAAVAWLAGAVRSGARRPLAAAGGAFAALAVVVNWPAGLHDGRWEEGLRLAQKLAIDGRYEEAEAWAARVEPRELRRGATRYGVGAQLLLAGQHERARPYLEEALRAEGNGNPATHFALGQALLRAGRPKEALPHLRRGFEGGIELPGGGYDLALALAEAGELREAAVVIPRIKPAPSEGAEGWLKLGRLAVQAQAPEIAEPLFRRAVAMRPDDAAAHQQLGLNLLVLRRYEEASRELAIAVRLDPGDPDTLARLAFCEVKLGRLEEARGHTAAALRINPQDPLALQLAAELRLRQ